MSTVYAIIDRSYNYNYRGDVSAQLSQKLEAAGSGKMLAVRTSVHLASMYDIAFSILKQMELFRLNDTRATAGAKVLTIGELAQSLKFHTDAFCQQAEMITERILEPNADISSLYEKFTPTSLGERIKDDRWFQDRYDVIGRSVSRYAPRLIAVRWAHSLLDFSNDLVHLIDSIDELITPVMKKPEEIKNLWLDISFNWTTTGVALTHLGDCTPSHCNQVEPGLIGWSPVLVEEIRIEDIRAI